MSDLAAGAYEQLVTHALNRRLRAVPSELVKVVSVEPAAAEDHLIHHIAGLIRHALRGARTPEQQIDRANRIAEVIIEKFLDAEDEGERIAQPAQLLTEVRQPSEVPGRPEPLIRPETPSLPVLSS